MPDVELLATGEGDYRLHDPDALRAWMRDRKRRDFVDKTTTAADAVGRLVADGDYVSFDFSSFTRGPLVLIREIIRQRRRNLWYCAKFTLMESTLLVAAGACVEDRRRVHGPRATRSTGPSSGARSPCPEWTNGTLTLRHLAGAMGVPFLPTRALLGSRHAPLLGRQGHDAIPFTGKPIALVPALNPDVGLVHVHQADVYGNARCFGPAVQPLETAMASRKVIVSTDEIIDHDEIRKAPGRTTIPYYLVDAVVYAPFGAYPGGLPGVYEIDFEHFAEYFGLERLGRLGRVSRPVRLLGRLPRGHARARGSACGSSEGAPATRDDSSEGYQP